MAKGTTQISANISVETKERMEQYVRANGVKKSHLIETAILHHLRALGEISPDAVVPPVLELTRQSGERILERIENPRAPTTTIKALFDD